MPLVAGAFDTIFRLFLTFHEIWKLHKQTEELIILERITAESEDLAKKLLTSLASFFDTFLWDTRKGNLTHLILG